MPQLNILSLITGAARPQANGAASSLLPQAVEGDGFAPFLSQNVSALLVASAVKEAGQQNGNTATSLPGLVASFFQNLSLVVSDEGGQESATDTAGQQQSQQDSPLLGRIIQLLQQEGQGVAIAQNPVAALTNLLKPEQLQELASLLQVSVEDVKTAVKSLIAQSEAIMQQMPLRNAASIRQTDEDEDKIFDPSQLLAGTETPSASTVKSHDTQPDVSSSAPQSPYAVLLNTPADPTALEKIQSLFGDALTIIESPVDVTLPPAAFNPSVIASTTENLIESGIALPLTPEEEPDSSPDAAQSTEAAALFSVLPASAAQPQVTLPVEDAVADSSSVSADMQLILNRTAEKGRGDTPALSTADNIVDSESPASQDTGKSQSHPALTEHQQNISHKKNTLASSKREQDSTSSRQQVDELGFSLSTDVAADSIADSFALRTEQENFAVSDSRENAISVKEIAAHVINSKLVEKTRHAAERAYLRDNAVGEQILVKIRDLPQPGSHRIQIQLDPQELGKVDVTMDVTADGRTQLTMTVDRKDTLEMLQRDRVSLEKALGDLGLKTDAGGMQFNLREQPKGQQQASGDSQHQQQGNHRNPEVLPEELREDILPLEPYRSYLLSLDESVNISV